jgi:hypothetical protein
MGMLCDLAHPDRVIPWRKYISAMILAIRRVGSAPLLLRLAVEQDAKHFGRCCRQQLISNRIPFLVVLIAHNITMMVTQTEAGIGVTNSQDEDRRTSSH